MFLSSEIDDNVIQIALYKMREVNGGTNVKLVERNISDNVPYEMMMHDAFDYLGITIEIENIKTFITYDHLKDMCSLQFGNQIAENFVNKTLGKL
jgi:hypothetical protein